MKIKKIYLFTLLAVLAVSLPIAFLFIYKSDSISEKLTVTKIIDGDTIIVEGGRTIRLLGIDSDERGYPCYQEAKNRLESLVLGKEVKLEKDNENKGKHGRYLRYIFLNATNINVKLLREGLAITRISGTSKYKDELQRAEKSAKENGKGCEWKGEEKVDLSKGEWDRLVSEDVSGACSVDEISRDEVIVQGKVVDSHKGEGVVFLNFEKPYPNSCFTAVIWDEDWKKFPNNPEEYYLNKLVRVKGKIEFYKGRPEIFLENPLQIEISTF